MRLSPLLFGVITFGALSAFCVRRDGLRIEADVKARVSLALSGRQFTWATLRVSGRDVVLSGMALTAASRDQAIHEAGAVRGVRVVDASALGVAPPR